MSRLELELNMVDEKRAIVFVNTKNKCDFVSKHLDNLGYRCTVLHGSKTQVCRQAPPLPSSLPLSGLSVLQHRGVLCDELCLSVSALYGI